MQKKNDNIVALAMVAVVAIVAISLVDNGIFPKPPSQNIVGQATGLLDANQCNELNGTIYDTEDIARNFISRIGNQDIINSFKGILTDLENLYEEECIVNSLGSYRFYHGDTLVAYADLSRDHSLGDCLHRASLIPDTDSVYCTWNGEELFRRDIELGVYKFYHSDSLSLKDDSISRVDALGDCQYRAKIIPQSDAVYCTWNEEEIFRRNAPTCEDSDGGKDPFTEGFTIDQSGRVSDYCIGVDVVEHYCVHFISIPETIACEHGCFDGACLDESEKCSDSDNGKDYYTKGTVTWLNYTNSDYCRNNNLLWEYYCDASRGGRNGESVDCLYGCEDGACIDLRIDTSGLVLLMDFEKESGENDSIVNDLSVEVNTERAGERPNYGICNGNNCPVYSYASRKFGSTSMFFDGNDEIVVFDHDSLDITRDMTVSMWINPAETQNSYATILSKHSNGGFTIEQNNANANEFYFSWDSRQGFYECTLIRSNLKPNTWQHLAFSKNGSLITHYVDGVVTAQCFGNSETITPNALDLTIGEWSAVKGRGFKGFMDELAIWNRHLSPNEIGKLYERGLRNITIG